MEYVRFSLVKQGIFTKSYIPQASRYIWMAPHSSKSNLKAQFLISTRQFIIFKVINSKIQIFFHLSIHLPRKTSDSYISSPRNVKKYNREANLFEYIRKGFVLGSFNTCSPFSFLEFFYSQSILTSFPAK